MDINSRDELGFTTAVIGIVQDPLFVWKIGKSEQISPPHTSVEVASRSRTIDWIEGRFQTQQYRNHGFLEDAWLFKDLS